MEEKNCTTQEAGQQQLSEEKENLAKRARDLEHEVQSLKIQNDALRDWDTELEKEMTRKEQESWALKKMLEEKEEVISTAAGHNSRLHAIFDERRRILTNQRDALVIEKENAHKELAKARSRVLEMEEEAKKNEKEGRSKTESSRSRIRGLNRQVEKLQSEKTQLEEKMAIESGKASTQINELVIRVKTLEAQKSEVDMEVERKCHELLENKLQIRSLNENLWSSDIKQKKFQDRLTEQMRDLEIAKDEVNAHLEKLRVTEEKHKGAEKKFEEECEILKQRIHTLERLVVENKEAYHRMIMDIFENLNNSVSELEFVIRKLQEEEFTNNIARLLKEITLAKNQVIRNNVEIGQLREEGMNLREETLTLEEGEKRD